MSWAEQKARESVPLETGALSMGTVRLAVLVAIRETIDKCAEIAADAGCEGECRGNLYIAENIRALGEP